MSETWRPVGYRLIAVPVRGYEASDLGRCRSVPRTLRDGRAAGGIVLSPWLDKDGYEIAKFGRWNMPVHVAVALAFHGRPEVRHLNGDQHDNSPQNLGWGSHKENEQDKKERGKLRQPPSPVQTDLGR